MSTQDEVHDGMIGEAVEIRRGPAGWAQSAPCTCRHHGVAPPPGVREVIREEHLEHEGPAESLGLSAVTSVVDERSELCVRDRVLADPERTECDLAGRALTVALIPMRFVGAHHESAAGKLHEIAVVDLTARSRNRVDCR